MFEPTLGGTWLKWSALDRVEKPLVAATYACFSIGTVMLLDLTRFGHMFYAMGYRAGSGGLEPPPGDPFGYLPINALTVLATVVLFAAGVLLWSLFSRRQDELFNRVQNRCYGIGSFVTLGVLGLWEAGRTLELVGPIAPSAIFMLWVTICGVVWMRDARRWWG